MRLFPRLRLEGARQLAVDLSALEIDNACARSAVSHPETVFAPIGAPVSEGELQELQQRVRSLAKDHGYPESRGRTDLARWDVESAITLHRDMGIRPAEAVHAGLWAFVGCVLLPDVVRWRWDRGGSAPVERFLGAQRGIRNTFGRLWWRCEVLRDDRDADYTQVRPILEALGEDQHVQITERPGLAADRVLARCMAAEYMRLTAASDVPGEALMRDAAKRIRRRLAFVDYQALAASEVTRQVSQIFKAAAASLHVRQAGSCEAHEEEAGEQPPSSVDEGSARVEGIVGPGTRAPGQPEDPSGEPTERSPDLADLDAWERGDIDSESVQPDIDVLYASCQVEVVDRADARNSVSIDDGANLVDLRPQLRSLASDGGSSLALAIVSVVVGFQRHFLQRGLIGLESMSQSRVAAYLDVHESTVSRAISDVFVRTPHGTYPLRFFFAAGIRHRSGKELSVRAVRVALRSIVLREPPNDPLSDDQIVEELQAKGLDIARRTVAKYRSILEIPDARGRRGGSWRTTPPAP